MVTFIILIGVERHRINAIAEQLVDMKPVSEVYSVTGNYDLVAIVRARTNDEVADFVTRRLATVEGIERTDTMLAFQAFSRHDLDAMFSI